jgi:excisionase family DNA binding protein
MKPSETYLTTKEVQQLLTVSRATLHRWRTEKKIKAKKFQGIVRYKLSDINKMMQ